MEKELRFSLSVVGEGGGGVGGWDLIICKLTPLCETIKSAVGKVKAFSATKKGLFVGICAIW